MESISLKDKIVLPGDYIGQDLVVGHGTYSLGNEIFASVAGVVHQINNVIYVKPIKQHYQPEIGDIVVGRVAMVDQKRWLVDINSYQHGILNLTSTMLPGGEQRRKSQEDQVQMRQFLKEGDVVCAEVQGIGNLDHKISLQTRSIKYSKVINGFVFHIDHNLIRRVKNHIVEFFSDTATPIGAIIGTNGNIFIFQEDPKQRSEDLPRQLQISKEARERMSMLRNAMVALEKAQLPVFRETVIKVLEQSSKQGLEAKDVVGAWEKVTTMARGILEKELKMSGRKAGMVEMQEEDYVMMEQ